LAAGGEKKEELAAAVDTRGGGHGDRTPRYPLERKSEKKAQWKTTRVGGGGMAVPGSRSTGAAKKSARAVERRKTWRGTLGALSGGIIRSGSSAGREGNRGRKGNDGLLRCHRVRDSKNKKLLPNEEKRSREEGRTGSSFRRGKIDAFPGKKWGQTQKRKRKAIRKS